MSRAPTWTDADHERATQLFAEHRNYSTVAAIMGFSRSTVFDWLNGRRGLGTYTRVIRDDAGMHVPPEVLAERDRRRELVPRDLTAAFFGDPLPGYSALERR